MKVSAAYTNLSAFAGKVLPSANSGPPSNRDEGARSRSDYFTTEPTIYSGVRMERANQSTLDLPNLGNALKNLFAGHIRRKINDPSMGEKLISNPSQMAGRVLHYAFNQ